VTYQEKIVASAFWILEVQGKILSELASSEGSEGESIPESHTTSGGWLVIFYISYLIEATF
jgi:hypothetical protein